MTIYYLGRPLEYARRGFKSPYPRRGKRKRTWHQGSEVRRVLSLMTNSQTTWWLRHGGFRQWNPKDLLNPVQLEKLEGPSVQQGKRPRFVFEL